MYAAYLYIFRAFDGAAASRLAKSPDPEREIADGRWPVAACGSGGARVSAAEWLHPADGDPAVAPADTKRNLEPGAT
jgi:hypothetical protein